MPSRPLAWHQNSACILRNGERTAHGSSVQAQRGVPHAGLPGQGLTCHSRPRPGTGNRSRGASSPRATAGARLAARLQRSLLDFARRAALRQRGVDSRGRGRAEASSVGRQMAGARSLGALGSCCSPGLAERSFAAFAPPPMGAGVRLTQDASYGSAADLRALGQPGLRSEDGRKQGAMLARRLVAPRTAGHRQQVQVPRGHLTNPGGPLTETASARGRWGRPDQLVVNENSLSLMGQRETWRSKSSREEYTPSFSCPALVQ